jgi:phospho-N-acetylmuramoyl-pentapeptide-transferase
MTVLHSAPPITLVTAFLMPMVALLVLGRPFIARLQKLSFGQYIREDGPQGHHKKAGTPTGGGVLMLLCLMMGALTLTLLGRLSLDAWVAIAVALLHGLMGFADDSQKILKKHNKGLTGWSKLAVQAVIGLAFGAYLLYCAPQAGLVHFFGLGTLDFGGFYPLFAALVVIATSNAVNLTDGLDGLASFTSLVTFLSMACLFAGVGLFGHEIRPDLAYVSLLFAGTCVGFLRFNAYPAKIFMGDTGSMALGGAVAALALLGRFEFWIFLLGGIFVAEALSVILQVASYKTTKKRIFRMAPLHHHFELSGWHETKVVRVFTIVQAVLCLGTIFWFSRA